MKIKILYLAIVLFVTSAIIGSGETVAFFTTFGNLVNSFTAGTVMIETEGPVEGSGSIILTSEEECKEINLTIKNTGTKDAFVRARFIGLWNQHRNIAKAEVTYNGETYTSEDAVYFQYAPYTGNIQDLIADTMEQNAWFTAKNQPIPLSGLNFSNYSNDLESSDLITASNTGTSALALSEINQYLVIGMGANQWGRAVSIGGSQEIGANRQTLSGGNVGDAYVSPLVPIITNSGPSDQTTPNLYSTFFKKQDDPTNPAENRWPWDSTQGAHYLPDPVTSEKYFMERGVDWSGNVAVTAPNGTYTLSNINVFATHGFRTQRGSGAAMSISNSLYFADNQLTGVLMGTTPNQNGWAAGYAHSTLRSDLQDWSVFTKDLAAEHFLTIDIEKRNSTESGGPFVLDVKNMDVNNDGFVVVDINRGGSAFKVSESDWIIKNSNYLTEGKKVVILRVRGSSKMEISNSSIVAGEGLGCNNEGLGVIFVKVPGDLNANSGNNVFTASNFVAHRVAFWDLNNVVNGRTYITFNNAQGYTQLIGNRVNLSNVRFRRCTLCESYIEEPEPGLEITKQVSVDGGANWENASEPTGPVLPEGVDPQFKIVVTNTGDVRLEDILVTDNIFGSIDSNLNLDPNESREYIIDGLDWKTLRILGELDPDDLTIELCNNSSDWVKGDDGFFYYTISISGTFSGAGGEKTLYVRICLTESGKDKYGGLEFTLYGYIEAVQASHGASNQVWGWEP